MSRPSGWRTTVLQAPLISADGSRPSSRGMDRHLVGDGEVQPSEAEQPRGSDGCGQVFGPDAQIEVAPVEPERFERGVLHLRGRVALDRIAVDGDVLRDHDAVPARS